MARIQLLNPDLGEERLHQREVVAVDVLALAPLDQKCRSFPCAFARGVRKVTNKRDGGAED